MTPFSQSMASKVLVGVFALSIALNGVFEVLNSGAPHTTPNDIMLGHKLIHGSWNAVDRFKHMRLDNLTSGASKDFYNAEDANSNHLSRNIDYLMLGSYKDQMMYIDTSSIEV